MIKEANSRKDHFYFCFSNKCLWPLFHYFIEFHQFDTHQWEYYVQVNQKFADEVLKIALTKELKKTEWVEVDMSKKDDKSQASIQ